MAPSVTREGPKQNQASGPYSVLLGKTYVSAAKKRIIFYNIVSLRTTKLIIFYNIVSLGTTLFPSSWRVFFLFTKQIFLSLLSMDIRKHCSVHKTTTVRAAGGWCCHSLFFCTRITTCYPDRVATGPHSVPGLPHGRRAGHAGRTEVARLPRQAPEVTREAA